MLPADYHILNSQILFDNPYARIQVDTLEHKGQQRSYFYLISPVEAVATVGLTDQGEILLTRQYRHPIQQTIYDLPAGGLNPGEPPLKGARREFEEETGFYPEHIERLGYFNQFPGSIRAATHLFFASNLRPTRQKLDPGETLEVIHVPVHQVLDMILAGDCVDGSLQLGVLLAKEKGLLEIN